MATTAAKLMTAEEFWEWMHRPENRHRNCDLVRGEVVEMSKPGIRHGVVCGTIGWIFGTFARKRKKGYPCVNDTGMIIEADPDTVRGPDVSFFEDASTYEQVETGWAKVAPLVAVEVLSPNDKMAEVMEKIADQLKFGTKLVWLVNPESRTVTVYRPGKEPCTVTADQEITGEDVLPDFRCKVAEFFKLPGE